MTGTVRAFMRFLLIVVILFPGCSSKLPHEGKTVAELEEMLRSDDPQKQIQGTYGLSLLGVDAEPATASLIKALNSTTPLVRSNAALALGKIGPRAKEAMPALTIALGDPEWTVRRQAAVALGEIGPDASAAEGLRRMAQDKNKILREAAQEALKKSRAQKR
jgi:HEAT repeat protein